VWDGIVVILEEFKTFSTATMRDRILRRAPTHILGEIKQHASPARLAPIFAEFAKNRRTLIADTLRFFADPSVCALYTSTDVVQKTKNTLSAIEESIVSSITPRGLNTAGRRPDDTTFSIQEEEEEQQQQQPRRVAFHNQQISRQASNASETLLSEIICRQQDICRSNDELSRAIAAYVATLSDGAEKCQEEVGDSDSWLEQPCASVQQQQHHSQDYFVGGPKFSGMNQIYQNQRRNQDN